MASNIPLLKNPDFGRSISQISVKDDVFQYQNVAEHGKKMLHVIQSTWINQEFCDIELVVGREEKVIPAHRIVLVSFCEYFRGLLNPTMREGNQTSIRCLDHLDADAVTKLIEFGYTGSIQLNTSTDHTGIDELLSVLRAADYMHLQGICGQISLFLEKNLNEENCLGFLQCADYYSLNQLRKAAFNFSSRYFSTVCQGEEFNSLPLPFLKELLQSERLIVQEKGIVLATKEQEERVIESILNYILHDRANRLAKLPELLKLLKLPLLTTARLQHLEKNELIAGCEECLVVTKEAKATEVVKVKDDSVKGFHWARRRTSQGLLLREQCVYSGGGQVRPEVAKFGCRDVLEEDEEACVVSLKLGFRRWDGRLVLGGLQIFYSSGQSPKYGMELSTCEKTYEVNLAHNERIVRVDVHSGWMIDQLTFHTNLGHTFGPWGGEGGSEYTELPPTTDNARRQPKSAAVQNGELGGSLVERIASLQGRLQAPQQREEEEEVVCVLGCGYLAGVSGTVVSSQSSQGITHLRLMWGVYDFSPDQHGTHTDLIVDLSRLWICTTDMFDFREGDLFVTDPDYEHLPDRVSRKLVLHCRSGELVEMPFLFVHPCEDENNWDPR